MTMAAAEQSTFQKKANKEPLTYYDMNLSAQDHQTFFTCDADAGRYGCSRKYTVKFHVVLSFLHLIKVHYYPKLILPPGKPEYELMQTAWRERNPEARIKAAKEAIAINPECATGYILLSEEESEDIEKAEQKLREAYKIAEANHRRSQQLQHQSPMMESQHRRDTNVMIYIRRRLAMCARKLGRLKEVSCNIINLATSCCN